jgi:hypothetical protein
MDLKMNTNNSSHEHQIDGSPKNDITEGDGTTSLKVAISKHVDGEYNVHGLSKRTQFEYQSNSNSNRGHNRNETCQSEHRHTTSGTGISYLRIASEVISHLSRTNLPSSLFLPQKTTP